jgi:hypothetical protein
MRPAARLVANLPKITFGSEQEFQAFNSFEVSPDSFSFCGGVYAGLCVCGDASQNVAR